jgi:hypothetical protein
MKPSKLLIFGLVLIFGFGIARQIQNPSSEVADSSEVETIDELDTDDETVVSEATVGAEENKDALREFARRFVHVPDTRQVREPEAPSTDERDITAENVDGLVEANLEHALTGDMASGYFVTRTRMSCDRVAKSPEELENSINTISRRIERAQARGHTLPGADGYDQPWSFTQDMEANRLHMVRWYDACERLRAVFTDDLRQRLEMLALNGNVMARYLYATWPVEQLDAGEAFDQLFHWEELSREFSLANLHSGYVAGLMALGHSYLSGYFTRRDPNLALAFGVAALNCGFETISVRSYLAGSIDHLMNSEDPADQLRLQFVLTESDRLGQYCSS